MASTYTPILALEIPAHGDYSTTGWDNPMDNSLRALDTAYGGYLTLSVTGGTRQLTVTEASNPVIALNGTLSSDQYLYFPQLSGRRIIIPSLNLNGHLLLVRGNNGADTIGVYFWNGFGIPYTILVTPSRVFWDYGSSQPGLLAAMPTGFAGNGWLPCDGRSVNMGLHDLLWYTIGATWGSSGSYPSGSFVLPDYRGTVTAMADQIGTVPGAGVLAVNRGNRGILYGWGLTAFGGEATHQLQVAEMPGHNHPGSYDSGHGHTASQDAHTHTLSGMPSGPLGPGFVGGQGSAFGTVTTSGASANNVYIGTGQANLVIAAQGGWAAHNITQPTTTVMKMIRW